MLKSDLVAMLVAKRQLTSAQAESAVDAILSRLQMANERPLPMMVAARVCRTTVPFSPRRVRSPLLRHAPIGREVRRVIAVEDARTEERRDRLVDARGLCLRS